MSKNADKHIPLVIDLDGTLLRIDTLHELALRFFLERPLSSIFLMIFWSFRGVAVLKRKLSSQIKLDLPNIPIFDEVVEYGSTQKSFGRKIVLCTGSDELLATEVANHFNLFDAVIASDGQVNLVGDQKRKALEAKYGVDGFDYIGNSRADLTVWKSARKAIVVDTFGKLSSKIQKPRSLIETFNIEPCNLNIWLKQLRIHHWLKNSLLLAPIIISGHLMNLEVLGKVLSGFLSFSFIASATYIFNDLCDLNADRVHRVKRKRPIASGMIQIPEAIGVSAFLSIFGAILAINISPEFLLLFVLYTFGTVSYSLYLKRVVLFDVCLLASLFTVRLQAGAVLTPNESSDWFLIFSLFTFLSLAFLKRYIEIKNSKTSSISGREYYKSDEMIILVFGTGAAYAATMVFSLYLFSERAKFVIKEPSFIMLSIPVFVMWMGHIWMSAYRNKVDEDPILFAIMNKNSFILAICFIILLLFSYLGLPL